MLYMIAESIGLMLVAFGLFARLGWLLGGSKAQQEKPVPSVFDIPAAVAEITREAPKESSAALAVAANHFTSGLVAPEPQPEPKPQAVDVTPGLAMAASKITVDRLETSLQSRVSSLAAMTPESVEAAVQQAGTGLEPLRLKAPRGPADDLTVISGISHVQQQELNALGIYHFWQIAGWSPEHVAWMSTRAGMSRRIARENWMAQATKLARLN